jgi:pSer/pThr/pTyr-binding forkhead associated (FHA) protein
LPVADDEDEPATRAMRGADLAKLKAPAQRYVLQILDKDGVWQQWSAIGAGGFKLGRGDRNAKFPELNSLASRHLKLSFSGRTMLAEDMGSLNGVYRKLDQPVELRNGTRFRVGARIIEFRLVPPQPPVAPLVADDGEELWAADLQPLAYLNFIRPDGEPGVQVPITNPERTILGRESRGNKPVDIALPGDDWVSGQHAQIRRDGDRFLLEDLQSRNGTFLRAEGPIEVAAGDVLLVGRVLLRIVDSLG